MIVGSVRGPAVERVDGASGLLLTLGCTDSLNSVIILHVVDDRLLSQLSSESTVLPVFCLLLDVQSQFGHLILHVVYDRLLNG